MPHDIKKSNSDSSNPGALHHDDEIAADDEGQSTADLKHLPGHAQGDKAKGDQEQTDVGKEKLPEQTKRRLRVDTNDLFNAFPVEAAMLATFALPVVRTPIRLARDMVFVKYAKAMRYIIEKSALGVSYILSSIVNNKLTRYISPSVSSLDEKIESACTNSGKFLGRQLIRITSWAYYLFAVSFATTITWLFTALFFVGFPVQFAFFNIFCATIGSMLFGSLSVFETAKKECKTPLSLIVVVSISVLLVTIAALVGHALVAFIFALLHPLLIFNAIFSAPLYAISSLFGLDNKFNIYNYEKSIGTVQSYLTDRHEGSDTAVFLTPLIWDEFLVHESSCVLESCQWNDIPETELSSATLNSNTLLREARSST